MHSVSLFPFDEMLALAGAALSTAEGRPARLVAIDESAPVEFQLRVWVQGEPVLRSYCRNGRFRSDGHPDGWDLYLANEARAVPAMMPEARAQAIA